MTGNRSSLCEVFSTYLLLVNKRRNQLSHQENLIASPTDRSIKIVVDYSKVVLAQNLEGVQKLGKILKIKFHVFLHLFIYMNKIFWYQRIFFKDTRIDAEACFAVQENNFHPQICELIFKSTNYYQCLLLLPLSLILVVLLILK